MAAPTPIFMTQPTTPSQLAIIEPANVQLITSNIPTAWSESNTSSQRCLDAGQRLLNAASQGMTDELDQTIAIYLDKSRKTVAKINGLRTPFTKLFDDFRKQFTALENGVDPTKPGSIPFQLQQLRNQYAARKREEAEQQRRAALAEQQRQQAEASYMAAVESDFNQSYRQHLNGCLSHIMQLNQSVTIDNYQSVHRQIEVINTAIPEALLQRTTAIPAVTIAPDRLEAIRTDIWQRLAPQFRADFADRVTRAKSEVLAMLPSKLQELQRAAEASAEEAERIRKQIAERDAAEQQRKQSELAAQQAAQQQQEALARQQAEMGNLFDQAAIAQPSAYQPKTQVKKRVQPNAPAAFMHLLNFWWVKEGQFLSVEELSKIFKRQITFAEKCANAKDGSELINDPSLSYIDDIKAK